MAPKRANPTEVPPAVSSDEEEEVTSSGEEEEEDGSSSEGEEEEEPQIPLAKKTPPLKSPVTAIPSAADEDTEESGDESESDTPEPDAKPVAKKPMVAKAVSSSKRPPESLSQREDKEAKRPKKKATEEEVPVKKPAGGGTEDGKKILFQRLFSEEDEIALLKGMLDYSAAKKGADPNADMNAFYEFVKKSIHTDVTKAQVMDKLRRLKKKYENQAGKGKKGEDPSFSKAHDSNAFKLSKKIWGKEGISGKVESSVVAAAKSNGKAKGTISSGSLFDKRFGVGSLGEEILKHGFDVVDAEKKEALEARWKNFQIRELELFVERNEMVKDLAKLMLETLKSEE